LRVALLRDVQDTRAEQQTSSAPRQKKTQHATSPAGQQSTYYYEISDF